jgi:hypothetical protein
VLPIDDWFAELDAKVAEGRKMQEAANGKSSGAGFSQAEWAEARAKHKAKINDAVSRS